MKLNENVIKAVMDNVEVDNKVEGKNTRNALGSIYYANEALDELTGQLYKEFMEPEIRDTIRSVNELFNRFVDGNFGNKTDGNEVTEEVM
ncbi:hypothetical protein GLW05_20910 [Pontibacillus yanchengensis]|uniref:Uncharacterized protein n=1 Tax=Pontibacillus yanchengensis TaxID=462910 RepID=A0A6I5A6L0_9BACI|nr:hypothetical protein [Pontibacillus yanchengensis]MYL36035.1 hypothetical protein [Pontibacillus yanchengensis]